MALYKAKLAKAQAKVELAEAKLNFAKVKAPFDGIVDRQRKQLGSLVKEGDILTTLSDNSVMWVYFNVPEKQYLEYMANRKQHEAEDRIELVLANQEKFPYPGKIDNGQRCDRGPIRQHEREHRLPGGFPEPGRPAASRSDRHHPDPPNAQGCHRHPAAGDVRAPRQAIRLGRRQG